MRIIGNRGRPVFPAHRFRGRVVAHILDPLQRGAAPYLVVDALVPCTEHQLRMEQAPGRGRKRHARR